MKNNLLKKILSVFIFFFISSTNLLADEIDFVSGELNILEKGNILESKNGFEAYSNTGLEIVGKEFNYNKKLNTLKAEGNLEIKDKIKQIIIYSNKLIYYKNDEKLIIVGNTDINIENNYKINSSDVIYLLNSNSISSKKNTNFNDQNNNQIFLSEFFYNGKDKILSGKNVELVNDSNNKFFFNDFKLNLKKKEFVGKDLYYEIKSGKDQSPRIKGNTVVSDNNITKIYKGVYTTCKKREGCSPWVIEAQETTHDKENKLINYKNAWLKIYDKPVFYFPKFFHPDPTVKRQSGFLFPSFLTSKSLGASITIPYYHVISSNKDFTFKPKLYSNKTLIQNEYRQVEKNSSHISDFSFLLDNNNSKGHFFLDSQYNIESDYFDVSSIKFKLESTTNDTYLKKYSINSPIVNDKDTLISYIDYNSYKDDFEINIYSKVYENLNKLESDRYEYIFPYVKLSQKIDNYKFTSTSYYKKHETDLDKISNNNQVIYSSNDKISNLGFKKNWYLNFMNVNSSKNKDKTEKKSKLLGNLIYNLSYPLKKETEKFSKYFTPKLSFRLSPNKSENLMNEDRRLDVESIFYNDRLNITDAIEGGESLSLGLDYVINNSLKNSKFLDFGIAQVYRKEVEPGMPINSTIGEKSSDIITKLDINFNENISVYSNHNLDSNLGGSNYNYLDLRFSVNNFITDFIYLNDNLSVEKQSYLDSSIMYNFDQSSSLTFTRRENKETDLVEYNNLIYQFKNDCLTAGIEYKKKYYHDNDIKPEDELFFSLTIGTFGQITGQSTEQ